LWEELLLLLLKLGAVDGDWCIVDDFRQRDCCEKSGNSGIQFIHWQHVVVGFTCSKEEIHLGLA
jgi:hypothetical protein